MIYNMGLFYVIILMFFYFMFVYWNKFDKYLIILVVMMISVIKEREDYENLVLLLYCKGIRFLMYGIDGEFVFD